MSATNPTPEQEYDESVLEYHSNGALMCSDIQCEKDCGFSGGYSGYCSSCWRTLSAAEQQQATEQQKAPQAARSAAREVAKLEKQEAERKRARDQEEQQEAARAEQRRRVERLSARGEGACHPLTTASGAQLASSDDDGPQWDASKWSWIDPGIMRSGDMDEHTHANMDEVKRLMNVANRLTKALDGYEEGSSEGGEPFMGFVVMVQDHACLRDVAPEPLDILRVLIPDLPDLVCSSTPFNDHRVLPRGDEADDDKLVAYKEAAAILFEVCEKGTGFTISAGGNGDYFVGPVFSGAFTEDGNMVGVVTKIVWT